MLLLIACLIFKAVIIPLPIGLLKSIDNFKIALNVEYKLNQNEVFDLL